MPFPVSHRRYCLITLIVCGFACSTHAEERQPVASARPEVARVLDFLGTTDGVVIGQNVGHSNHEITDGFYKYAMRLHRETGEWPGLLGVDFGYDEIPPFLNSSSRLMEKHVRTGGIVTASMHMKNPWQNSEVGDRKVGDFQKLVTPGNRVYDNYRRSLDRVAKSLERLRDRGIVVLWRPLHEMNGGWFWWCANDDGEWTSPDDFVMLWKDMFRYFREEKKLNNLLWVYSVAVQKGDSEKSALEYYPGDDFVDIVGLDWYMEHVDELDAKQSYSQLASLNKPMGLTEFGPLSERNGEFDCNQLIEATEKYPRLRFAMFWHSWTDNHVAIVDHENGTDLMAHPGIITLDRIPSLRPKKSAAGK